MGTKRYSANTPGRRFLVTADFAEVTAVAPERSLTEPLRRTLRELNARLRVDPRVISTVVSLGDGLALVVKK